LCCSIALIVWVVVLGYLAAGAGVVAYIMALASWVVIPVLVIGVLVLAMIALLLNPVPGKVLGALAIVAPAIALVVFWNALGSADGWLFG
jgi:hypothetical protein